MAKLTRPAGSAPVAGWYCRRCFQIHCKTSFTAPPKSLLNYIYVSAAIVNLWLSFLLFPWSIFCLLVISVKDHFHLRAFFSHIFYIFKRLSHSCLSLQAIYSKVNSELDWIHFNMHKFAIEVFLHTVVCTLYSVQCMYTEVHLYVMVWLRAICRSGRN